MQENRRKVDEERQELQMLVSDVSHQVKTPVSNLKMVTDTLLSKSVTEEEQREFLKGIRNQTDKLEFLFQYKGTNRQNHATGQYPHLSCYREENRADGQHGNCHTAANQQEYPFYRDSPQIHFFSPPIH